MKKRMTIMLVALAIFVVLIALWKVKLILGGIAEGKKFAPPPDTVTTVVARAQKWQPTLKAVGSLKAVNGVTVSTDLAGIVSSIAFESGTPVKKGDLLVQLDTRQEESQLRSAEARRDLAKVNLERQNDLLMKKAASQSEYDSAAAEFRQAEAAVDDARAIIARKTIVAPFDGLLGIRMLDPGQYLNVGAPIVPLQSLDPIHVDFSLPQQYLDQIATGGEIRIKAEGVAGVEFDGAISAIDSRVDEITRNIALRGTIPNPERKLRPGMYVSVEVLLPEKEGVIAIPASAISYAPYGDSVFVVESKTGPDGKPMKQLLQQFVKVGPSRGDQVSIQSGVKAGDEVVSSGVFKLRSGAPVFVNNAVQPGNEPSPKPPET
jgi:membrane fusion protein (multidrug efflux system)